MLVNLGRAALRLYMRAVLSSPAQESRQIPLPVDAPYVHTMGSNSDRILLLGSGIAVGYGTNSHYVALGGHLARQLSASTGRGAFVDIIAEAGMTVSGARAELEKLPLSRFDAVVLTLGTAELAAFVDANSWRREIEELLDYLALAAPSSLHVFLVSTPGFPIAIKLPRPVRAAMGRLLHQLDAQSSMACAGRDQITFVPLFAPGDDIVRENPRLTYANLAGLIEPSITAVLNDQARPPRAVEPVVESERQGALDELGILDTDPERRFDRIVETARRLFAVSGASVSFIDRDRQWLKAAVGIDPTDIARTSSFCDTTIRRAEVFVVEDANSDPRFRDKPWVTGDPAVRFYAGYPIEAEDGHRVGAICVMDVNPRHFSDSDAALLRELAFQVETELRGAERRPTRV